jgi:hypothetical protein
MTFGYVLVPSDFIILINEQYIKVFIDYSRLSESVNKRRTGKKFEDTKGVIRIRKSKDRQHNGQKKRDKKE